MVCGAGGARQFPQVEGPVMSGLAGRCPVVGVAPSGAHAV